MASLLQVRNVPDGTRRRLKARAADRGESLNAYLLRLLDREAARPTTSEVLERAAARADRVGTSALDSVLAARAERSDEVTADRARPRQDDR